MTVAFRRVIVADDEPLARQAIVSLLRKEGDLEVVGECRTGVEVITAVKALRPDILFLDVEMPDLDGMTALRSLEPARRPLVVLVTAFDEFAVLAYHEGVLDYLVKPFSDERFTLCLDRLRRRLAPASVTTTSYRTVFSARVGRTIAVVAAGDVHWIEARDYCVRLHLDERSFLIRRSLAKLAGELDPISFVRVHRGAMVNVAHVAAIDRDPDGAASIRLKNGSRIGVSERRIADVRLRFP